MSFRTRHGNTADKTDTATKRLPRFCETWDF
ncbi:hypothetical protein CITRIK5_70098 [Citricoccus sp. K5]|nr:hypothetical protein CITRIK5_70098 [Citricoccus sp. K5]